MELGTGTNVWPWSAHLKGRKNRREVTQKQIDGTLKQETRSGRGEAACTMFVGEASLWGGTDDANAMVSLGHRTWEYEENKKRPLLNLL